MKIAIKSASNRMSTTEVRLQKKLKMFSKRSKANAGNPWSNRAFEKKGLHTTNMPASHLGKWPAAR